ncbi:hypothetical protein [Fusibacter ferrireducens]|uniref:Uncharacterized protein n=1 Tax=Fusibacter ferrireducens TaxID=2785058 RepID=A0ABR9ZM95_9FIRM|nr:hypothetical protein [Fusibacter ferrireducens]MBF4691588.1 hypothetical protein [Fusibacter ferrireducens]
MYDELIEALYEKFNLYEFCRLIDCLIKDIQHLESETVKTRYTLSKYLEPPYDEFMRSDILSGLAGRYYDHPAYKIYIQLLYNNQDPMDSDEWVDHITNLTHDHDDSEN